ncbi:hypothetical protein LIER_22790 [Lithospermum erythrorhizon]|uniref:Uncharacterized protein n=1 Tax=Lithospermum erythrorhizon TaxID=34254 RepID=A0AAV3QWD9_LITER
MPCRLCLHKSPLLLRPWPATGNQYPFKPPLASRRPSSSRLPPQSKAIRADVHRCDSELSKTGLVNLRSRYDIPSSVMLLHLEPTGRATTPPPGIRTFFIVALNNGLRLPVYPYIGEVLSLAEVCPVQLMPNMWLSIIGSYSACLLHDMTPTTEFFLTSSSQRNQKNGFLYFTVRPHMKGLCEAFLSKVEPDTWRPFFFYVDGDGLPPDVPSSFTEHPKSNAALIRTTKHKADAHAFSTYWQDNHSMPLHFYTDHCVLKVAGLFPVTIVDLGVLEALRVSFSVPEYVPLPPPAAVPDQPP